MKQFQKYGVAAAVASVAVGAVATEVSKNEAGDLAIVPYYTVLDGKNTGIHIINTTESTQVVKVRLRRGADSKDALDFNLVMSPRDEWTANIGAGGSTGVQVTTNDTTCTVPEFPNGVAQMPSTYAEGATEGYVEIIAMAQAAAETYPIAVDAEHDDGVPADCDAVRENFYRVAAGNVSTGVSSDTDYAVRGVHTSRYTSNGACATAAPGAAVTACRTDASAFAENVSVFADSNDQALKVSYFVTDSTGGLEFGDNAVMIEGFASAPMMTNQQPLSFGTAGVLQYDPLNFELPNLAYGSYASSNASRQTEGANGTDDRSSGALFNDLRDALNADALINDWAAFDTDSGSVAADWVVTLPGQYAMNNAICDMYDSYSEASDACVYTGSAVANGSGIVSAGVLDQDELPLILASNTTNNAISGKSNLSLWDREETSLNPTESAPSGDLGFSPGGSAGDPTTTAVLRREVNVISFNEGNVLGSAALQDEDFGLRVAIDVPGGDRGWARLAIQPSNPAPMLWTPNGEAATVTDGGDVDPNESVDSAGDGFGTFTAVTPGQTMAIGMAVWERSFADQAGNYGRAIEHTTQGMRS